MLPFHLNFRSFGVPYVHVLVTSCRDTDKKTFLRSILDMSFPFKFITGRWSSSSLEMLTKKNELKYRFWDDLLSFLPSFINNGCIFQPTKSLSSWAIVIHGGGDIWKGSKTRKGVWFLFKISTITELLVRLDQFLVNNASCPDIGAFTKYSRGINLFITGYTHAYMEDRI